MNNSQPTRRGRVDSISVRVFREKNLSSAQDVTIVDQLMSTIPHNIRVNLNIDNPQKMLTEGINQLVYGTFLKRLSEKGNIRERFFFLSDEDNSYLHYFSKTKPIRKTRINLKRVVSISIDQHPKGSAPFMNTMTLETELKKKFSRSKSYSFIFDSEAQKIVIVQALEFLVNQANYIEEDEHSKATEEEKKKDVVAYLNKNDPKSLKDITPQNLDNLFRVYQNSVGKSFQQNDFDILMQDLTQKKEVLKIYEKYCQEAVNAKPFSIDEPYMTLSELIKFWKQEQFQDLQPKEFEHSIKGFEKINRFTENPFIIRDKIQEYQEFKFSFKQFAQMLFHKSNSVFDVDKKGVYQAMTNPLTDYYICSSHNTYLEGNQFQGISSCNAYINAIAQGCRCVEIDCWDGSDGDPIVYHGYTLTTKIKFREVIQTIAMYAFKWSEYPLILSLEVHCSYEQQGKMADIMMTEFWEVYNGEKRYMIYTLPKDFNKMPSYPSPAALKRFILIKGKGSIERVAGLSKQETRGEIKTVSRVYLTQWRETVMRAWYEQMQVQQKSREKEEQINKKYSMVLDQLGDKVEEFKDQFRDEEDRIYLKENLYQKRSHSAGRASFANLQEIDDIKKILENKKLIEQVNRQDKNQMLKHLKDESHKQERPPTASKVHEKLESLIILFSTPFDVESSKDRSFWQISSFDEYKFLRLATTNEAPMSDFHRFYFSRIYPSGQRVQSSNYEPMPALLSGSQMIALNFQTLDLPLFVMLSKFQENGGQYGGYLLKPSYMRLGCKNPKYPKDFRKKAQKVYIKIISGQYLRREVEGDVKVNLNPQVYVFIRGSDLDDKNITAKTKIVSKNGFNPRFDSDEFKFDIYSPDHSVIIFEVYTVDSKLSKKIRIGWYGLPVNCIRQGYRVVPLRNSKFSIVPDSYLFIKIRIENL